MEDGINLDRASVWPPEEHPPVADPETKRRSGLHALDVANARSGVLIDAGNDSCSCWRVDPSQVTARPSREHNARVSQRLYRRRLPASGVGFDAFHAVNIYASTVILMFEGATPNDRASPAFASAIVSARSSGALALAACAVAAAGESVAGAARPDRAGGARRAPPAVPADIGGTAAPPRATESAGTRAASRGTA